MVNAVQLYSYVRAKERISTNDPASAGAPRISASRGAGGNVKERTEIVELEADMESMVCLQLRSGAFCTSPQTLSRLTFVPLGPAHLFTKALDKGSFIKFRDVMMNNHNPLREALAAAVCQMHGDAKRIAKRLAQQL